MLVSVGCVVHRVGYGLGGVIARGTALAYGLLAFLGLRGYMRIGNMGMSLSLVNDLDEMYGIA